MQLRLPPLSIERGQRRRTGGSVREGLFCTSRIFADGNLRWPAENHVILLLCDCHSCQFYWHRRTCAVCARAALLRAAASARHRAHRCRRAPALQLLGSTARSSAPAPLPLGCAQVERSFSNIASVSSGFGGGGGGGGGGHSFFDDDSKPSDFGGPRAPPQDDGFARGGKPEPALPKSLMPAKGMVLGKGPTKTNAFIESLRAEGEAVEAEAAPQRTRPVAATPAAALAAAEPVTISIEEKLARP